MNGRSLRQVFNAYPNTLAEREAPVQSTSWWVDLPRRQFWDRAKDETARMARTRLPYLAPSLVRREERASLGLAPPHRSPRDDDTGDDA